MVNKQMQHFFFIRILHTYQQKCLVNYTEHLKVKT